MTYTSSTIQEFLAGIYPFDRLSSAARVELSTQCQWFRYRIGQAIVTREKMPAYVGIIYEGKARLIGYVPHLQEPVTLKLLQSGEMLGWVGLVRGVPCETAFASGETICLVLSAENFLAVLQRELPLANAFQNQCTLIEVFDLLSAELARQANSSVNLKELALKAQSEAVICNLLPGRVSLSQLDDERLWFVSGGGAIANFPVASRLNLENAHTYINVIGAVPARLVGFPKLAELLTTPVEDTQQEGKRTKDDSESLNFIDAFPFLVEVLQATRDSNGDVQTVYTLLQANLEKLNENLAQQLRIWAAATLLKLTQSQAQHITAIIANFSNLICQFPLGNKDCNIEIAITGYEIVAQVFTHKEFPEQWAMLWNNLAGAYLERIRGERAENVERAISFILEALQVLSRQAFPEQWAITQNNLGEVYLARIRGTKAENIELAIAAFTNALNVLTRTAYPQQWATTQNNLGNAYSERILSERSENLEMAIAAYNAALSVFSREAFPIEWAMTQYKLGSVYADRIQGDKANNIEKTIAAYKAALKIVTLETFPNEWARTQNNLGDAYFNRIGGDKANNIKKAIAAYKKALAILTADTFPYEWAKIQNSLGDAYFNKIQGDKAENLEIAIACYQAALQIYTREAFPYEWASTCKNLGDAYTKKTHGDRLNNVDSLDNIEYAILFYEDALEIYNRETFPDECVIIREKLSNAHYLLEYYQRELELASLPQFIPHNEVLARIEFIQGDLLDLDVDALVNPTGLDVSYGGAISSQLFQRVGFELYETLQKQPPLKSGEVFVTDAGSLLARYLIHTPTKENDGRHTTTSIVRGVSAALVKADSLNNVRTIAFPSMGTGGAGFRPVDLAPKVLKAVINHLKQGSQLEKVIFAFINEAAYQVYVSVYQTLLHASLNIEHHSPDAWKKQGDKLLESKNYLESVASFDKAIKIKPNDHEIWNNRGIALAQLGRYQEAFASFDQAIKIKLDYHEAWFNKGEALFNLGLSEEFNFVRYEEAIASYNTAIKINPDFYQAWFNRGQAFTKLYAPEEAIASYKTAIKINPDFYQAWFNQGEVLTEQKKFEEAIASYDKTIEINPEYWQAWFNRGGALSELERFEEAIASYDKTIEINPEYWQAWFNRGVALSKLGRFEEASASYDKTVEIKPQFYEAWFNRGLSLFYLGQYEQALASYDKVIEIKPDSVEAWNSKGITLATLEQYEQALVSYNKVIEIKPNSVEAWNSRGVVLISLEQIEEAIVSFDRALQIKPDNYQCWKNRGSALDTLGRFEEAIASYDKALEIKPDDYQTWSKRGVAAEKLISVNQLSIFSSAVGRQNPALNQRGYQGKLSSYEEGLKYCHKDTHPEGWGILHQALGDAHYLQGERQSNYRGFWYKAIAEYRQALITLTPEAFPELHLEVVQSLIRALFGLKQNDEAEQYKQQGLDVLQRLLSSPFSKSKKQQLTDKFAGFNQLGAIKLDIITYNVLLNIPSEIIAIGGAYELTILINPYTFDEDNGYLLEMPRIEAIANELNIILKAPGFQFNGDNTASLPLDPDAAQETQTARFCLTALRPGNTSITAELYRGDAFETKLETQIQVSDIDEATFNPQHITTQPRSVPQVDFLLRIQTIWNETNSTCQFQYQLKSFRFPSVFPGNNIYTSNPLFSSWIEQVRGLLTTTLENISGSLPQEGKSRLKSLGQYLFQHLFPTELKSDYCTLILQNLTFTLLILADQDVWIPWQLLYDGQRFLGDRFIIGRWLQELNDTQPYEFPVGAVNVAHYANVEQPQLWANLLEAPGAPPPQLLPEGILHDSTEAIRGLHLIRYSQPSDAVNRRNAPIPIDSTDDAEDIERQMRPAKLNLRRHRPVVTLSYVKTETPELTALEQTWASAFIRAGCSGFIGSLWAVEPSVEAAFMSCFYNRLWAGASLGDAFYTSRQLARAAAPDSLDWLAYVLYGDPMARPYRPVPGDGYAIVEPIGREIDDPLSPGASARFRVSLRRSPPIWHKDRVIEVAENLVFENLQVHIVTYGLQVIPELPIAMTRTERGDYLGWFTLVVPAKMTDPSALVQVYFADGMRPIHSLTFSFKIESRREE